MFLIFYQMFSFLPPSLSFHLSLSRLLSLSLSPLLPSIHLLKVCLPSVQFHQKLLQQSFTISQGITEVPLTPHTYPLTHTHTPICCCVFASIRCTHFACSTQKSIAEECEQERRGNLAHFKHSFISLSHSLCLSFLLFLYFMTAAINNFYCCCCSAAGGAFHAIIFCFRNSKYNGKFGNRKRGRA